jgi:hypothetical protein
MSNKILRYVFGVIHVTALPEHVHLFLKFSFQIKFFDFLVPASLVNTVS